MVGERSGPGRDMAAGNRAALRRGNIRPTLHHRSARTGRRWHIEDHLHHA
jgi:hypothetical protein